MTPLRAIGPLALFLMLSLLAGCSTAPKVVTVVETTVVTLRPPAIDPCPQTQLPVRNNGELLSDRNIAARERDECASRVKAIIDWQDKHPEKENAPPLE